MKLNITELLQDGGGLPDVDIKRNSVLDWQRILMDAQADLTRQLCYYMEPGNNRQVVKCLRNIETICQQWRMKGPKE